MIALACGFLSVLPPISLAHGWSIDVLTALRWKLLGPHRDAASVPVAVIAIDEETYETPPFKGSPTLIWTTEIGRVLTAVLDGGAKVAGFDIVLANSIEQSELPFGDDAVGVKLRGFDRPFLRSLAAGAASGKVVLGEALRPDGTNQPADGQRIAVRGYANIRPLNILSDPDDVVRRVPLTFATKEKPLPSMALELASRALGAEPVIGQDGSVTLAGYRVPSAMKGTLTLNFDGGSADVRTYSLADLRACVEKDDKQFFQSRVHRQDRALRHAARCRRPQTHLETLRDRNRGIRSAALRLAAGKGWRALRPQHHRRRIYPRDCSQQSARARRPDRVRQESDDCRSRSALPCSPLLLHGCSRRPWRQPRMRGLVALTALGATLAFSKAYVIPLSEPFLSGLLALLLMIAWRLVVTDRGQRLLRRSFALYLAPQVIDRMLASNKLPDLGGETRDVTVFFSDLEGFSSISEKMSPTELVAFVNEYLSAMTDIIESKGGYVDKYIGNSIVAVFGAPVDDGDHARHAAEAALLCRAKLDELNKTSPAFRGHHRGASHGPQFRRGAGRQYRLTAALQLFRHERCGERRLTARRRQQVLWHDHHCLRDHGDADGVGIRMARARRREGSGPRDAGENL